MRFIANALQQPQPVAMRIERERKPTNSFSHSITWRSILIAAGADRQDVTF